MAEPDRGGPVDCILIKMEILILGGGQEGGSFTELISLISGWVCLYCLLT